MSEFMMNKHQATNERLKQERTMTEEASKPKTEKKPPYTYEAFMKDLNVHVETKDITREGLYLELKKCSGDNLTEAKFEHNIKVIRKALLGTGLAMKAIPLKKRTQSEKIVVPRKKIGKIVLQAAKLGWDKPVSKK
jgi:hypothetical protein|tara:strand:+ start:318 stop:725 length:408 start_codon:yes stop_codon:yes gene_type:complete